jgi:YYY domain-containing protein
MPSSLLDFISWYLLISLLGWLSLPLVFRFFAFLPGRGFALAKPAGLLLSGYFFWLLGTFGFTRIDAGGAMLAALLVGGLGLAWNRGSGLHELWRWLVEHRVTLLGIEAVFLLAFGLWAVVRAYNPEIYGTEKPMELMFLNSILASPGFPPQDAWLAGHAVSYYYFGYVLVGFMVLVTGVSSGVGFNLALALFFALTAVAAFGTALDLLTLAGQRFDTAQGFSFAPARRLQGPALLAPVLLLLAGNMYGALELLHTNGLLREAEVPAVWYVPADPAVGEDGGIQAGMINLWDWLDLKQLSSNLPAPPAEFRWSLGNWFFASRAIHDRGLAGAATEAIDEFPSFSFLLGDLHPHVLALPYVLLALCVGLEWMLWSFAHAHETAARRSHWRKVGGKVLLSAVLLGALGFLNTWDLPIYAFVLVLLMLLGGGLAQGWAGLWQGRRFYLVTLASLLLLAIVFYFPFYLAFRSQAGGILPNFVYPTRLHQLLVMFLPVLAGTLVYLIWTARRSPFDRRAGLWAGVGLPVGLMLLLGLFWLLAARSGELARVLAPYNVEQGVSLLLQRRLIDSGVTLLAALMVFLAVGILVGRVRQAAPQSGSQDNLAWIGGPPNLTMTALLVFTLTGALLVLGPEFVYLRDNFGTRMNTLFKFYYQVWVLWSLTAAVGMALVFRRVGSARRAVLLLGLVPLILASLVYLPGSLMSKTGGFGAAPTLDGMAYFARSYPDDWAAVQWLKANASPQAVILEGSRGAYWVEGPSSRFSMATGTPTVIGWVNHQMQWRGSYFSQVAGREADVRTVYQTRDWEAARPILEAYQVSYVILGGPERSWYGPADSRKFDQHLVLVFEHGATRIYRVPGSSP